MMIQPVHRFLLALMLVAAVIGCDAAPSTSTVDGFVLGALAACSPPVGVDAAALDASCAGLPKRAIAALDARDPGHAPITSTQMYTDGRQPAGRDDAVTVFVFKLADGSTIATGVECSGEPTTCIGIGAYPP